MRTNPENDDYKYWVKFNHLAAGNKNVKDLTWDKLIGVLCEKKPNQIEAVIFDHSGCPHGNDHIEGTRMLELWKEVEKRKALEQSL